MGMKHCARGLVVLGAAVALVAQERRGSVSGIVVDALHEPLAAVEVMVTSTIDDEVLGKAISDGSGAFLVPRLPVGLAYLRADAKTDGRALGMAGFQLLPERPNVHGAVVRLYDAGQVTGRVVDAQGQPLAGVHVEALPEPGTLAGSGEHRLTDADGRFVMTNVPLGDLTVCAFRPGYAFGEQRLRLRDQADVDLRLAAEPDQIRRRVRVLGTEPSSLVGVRFRVSDPTDRLPGLLLDGRPDAKGEWSFVQLAGFEYRRVRVSSPTLTIEPRVADVPEDLAATIDFHVIEREASMLHGRLLGPDGAPLAGETIVCRAPDGGARNLTKSGSDGRFEVACPAAPGGTCWLYLIDGRYVADQDRNVIEELWGTHQFEFAPSTTVTVRAIPAARVRGRVVDANGPVRGARVHLCTTDPSDATRMDRAWSTNSDLEGRFEWNRVRATDRSLWVEVEGYAGAGISERFTIEAGGEIEIEVRTKPAGVVEGEVVDAEGKGLPGMPVRLRLWNQAAGAAGAWYGTNVITDRHGRYRHVGVLPGSYRLQIQDDRDTVAETEPFKVDTSATVRHKLTLR